MGGPKAWLPDQKDFSSGLVPYASPTYQGSHVGAQVVWLRGRSYMRITEERVEFKQRGKSQACRRNPSSVCGNKSLGNRAVTPAVPSPLFFTSSDTGGLI